MKTTYNYTQNVVAAPSKDLPAPNKSQELENELKHLNDRLKGTEKALNSLVRKRNDGASTAPTTETLDDEDDEVRESLENQLQGIKTRLSRVEDNNGKFSEIKTSEEFI